jgi:hypothetical protein
MIESGLSSWALANAAIKALLGQSPQDVAQKTYSAFYFSFLPKQAPLPAIILDRYQSEEAADSIDVRTAAPTLLEGGFQFGCVANDAANPGNQFSGYLACAALSRVIREQLLGLATGDSALPDGTVIEDLRIVDEFDAHFEPGGMGTGYLYRRVLKVWMMFKETA